MERTFTLTLDFVKDFLAFLKQNGALEFYTKNTFLAKRENIGCLYDYFKQETPGKWILSAFTWSESSEGLDFWSKINREWQSKVYAYWPGDISGKPVKIETNVINLSKCTLEPFLHSGLAGKWYEVTDGSWNRPATWAAESDAWELDIFHRIGEEKIHFSDCGRLLVLSKVPELKEIVSREQGIHCTRPMIKVWVPEKNSAWWVPYFKRAVKERK